jgi:hypothetical protein
MVLNPDHYCIQAKRIEKMDRKLDDIHEQFQVDGAIGVMSGQLTRLTTLAENGTKKKDNLQLPGKIIYWIIAGLVAIIAALVGANPPLG